MPFLEDFDGILKQADFDLFKGREVFFRAKTDLLINFILMAFVLGKVSSVGVPILRSAKIGVLD